MNMQHSNPLVDLFPELRVDKDSEYQTRVWEGMDTVPWRPWTCLECWPRRDLNEFVLPSKNLFVDVTVTTATTATASAAASVPDTFITGVPIASHKTSYTQEQSCVFGDPHRVEYLHIKAGMERTDIVVGEEFGILEQERRF